MRHINLSQAFREESRGGTSGRAARAVRRLLVASQIAFAFMLLVGAGLLLASFDRILAINPGFTPDRVLTARVSPPGGRYKDDPALRTFTARLLERVRSSGAVLQAGITSNIPFGGNFSDSVNGVTGMEPVVLAVVGGVLASVAVAACSVPARRAARINPIVALGE